MIPWIYLTIDMMLGFGSDLTITIFKIQKESYSEPILTNFINLQDFTVKLANYDVTKLVYGDYACTITSYGFHSGKNYPGFSKLLLHISYTYLPSLA